MKLKTWVIKFPNNGKPFWLSDWTGDPGMTVLEKNAQRYATESAAKRARTIAAKENPHRDLSEFKIYQV